MPPARSLDLDILLLGGGVAGLWTLTRLRKLGFNCLLLEKTALGSGQSVASQGIIHGGVKYALTGEPSDAATSIAQMPRIWDECLGAAANGEVDLSSCRVLSNEQHLWTTPGFLSRIAGFGASKMLRSDGERMENSDRPAAFAQAPPRVDIYRVPERVLDARSIIEALAAPANSGNRARAADAAIVEAGPVPTVRVGSCTIRTRAVVLAAGAGNAALMRDLGLIDTAPRQQCRPLHMVMARPAPVPIFGHCLEASSTPRLTITTSTDPASGELVWYIGGAIAEDAGGGVARSPADQIAACREELRACLSWLDTSELHFATLRVDRAEGVQTTAHPPRRPDEPTLARKGPIIVGWPTKLAFAPAFASRTIDLLKEVGIQPSNSESPLSPDLGSPPRIAPFPWETATWT